MIHFEIVRKNTNFLLQVFLHMKMWKMLHFGVNWAPGHQCRPRLLSVGEAFKSNKTSVCGGKSGGRSFPKAASPKRPTGWCRYTWQTNTVLRKNIKMGDISIIQKLNILWNWKLSCMKMYINCITISHKKIKNKTTNWTLSWN